jgi:uncharacterized iron-regulated protein
MRDRHAFSLPKGLRRAGSAELSGMGLGAGHRGAAYLACVVILFSLCALAPPRLHASDLEDAWQAPIGRDHPLVGRIWDVTAGAFIDSAALVDRLSRRRFVLLGEQHDNPDHHRLQARLLRAMIAAGRRPAVGFEMFSSDDAPAIARHLDAHPTDAAGLAEAVDWQRSGWPDWAMYRPIAETALAAGLPVVATNLSQGTVRELGQGGGSAPEAALVARLGLDRPLAADLRAAMAQEIRDAHCGYAPEPRVEAMITVQRARDAQMAESLITAGQRDGAVLIAGAGHTRRDYGVPVYLADKVPDASVVSLAFLEVSQDKLDPPAYAARFRRQTLPFDYVWFTPRVDDQDPCTTFREQLKKLQKQE